MLIGISYTYSGWLKVAAVDHPAWYVFIHVAGHPDCNVYVQTLQHDYMA